jgi:hypothetical protein
MELAVEAGLVKKPLMQDLMAEGKKILAIVAASRKTAKRRERVTDL